MSVTSARMRYSMLAANLFDAFADQMRAAIDQAGVELYEVGAGGDFFRRVVAIEDAAYADDADIVAQSPTHTAQDFGGARKQGLARKAAGLCRIRIAGHRAAIDRGVGADHTVDLRLQQHFGDRIELVLGKVGSDLQQHGFARTALRTELFLRFAKGFDKAAQRGLFLQVAQALRIR